MNSRDTDLNLKIEKAASYMLFCEVDWAVDTQDKQFSVTSQGKHKTDLSTDDQL